MAEKANHHKINYIEFHSTDIAHAKKFYACLLYTSIPATRPPNDERIRISGSNKMTQISPSQTNASAQAKHASEESQGMTSQTIQLLRSR